MLRYERRANQTRKTGRRYGDTEVVKRKRLDEESGSRLLNNHPKSTDGRLERLPVVLRGLVIGDRQETGTIIGASGLHELTGAASQWFVVSVQPRGGFSRVSRGLVNGH